MQPIYLTEVMAIWLKNCMRIVEFPSILHRAQRRIVEIALHRLAKAFGPRCFEIAFRYHVTGLRNNPSVPAC